MSAKIPVSAIICEFDPLHFGHKLLLDTVRASGSAVCCVMSGNFTQRAAPAILDKWTRARLALLNGADLVVELPLSWACAGAERFALGGVALAAALGADTLWFGSEIPDAPLLTRLAEALLSPAFSQALRACPDRGESFAQRRQQAFATLVGPEEAAVLSLPNANLGVEYIKAIRRLGANLRPCPIQRQGAGHGQAVEPAGNAPFLSASQLREMIRQGQSLEGLVPPTTEFAVKEAHAQGRCPADLGLLERAILYKLRTMTPEEFAALPDISEGLENRLQKAARKARSLEELYTLTKSRRTSHARVRRLVLSAFLGLRSPLPELPPYLRLLGMGPRAAEVLQRLSPRLPLVVRPKDTGKLPAQAQAVFTAEAAAGDLYALACPSPQPAGEDFTRKVIKI